MLKIAKYANRVCKCALADKEAFETIKGAWDEFDEPQRPKFKQYGVDHIDYNKFAYFTDGCICVFCGIENDLVATSTINAAEEIIRTIANEENKRIGYFRYFDLQTYSGGYSHLPGKYQLDELEIRSRNGDRDVEAVAWNPVKRFPLEILEQFRKYIGQELHLEDRFKVFGQFCQGLLSVLDKEEKAYHIGYDGKPAYKKRFADTSDFTLDGWALVSDGNDKWARINTQGQLLTDWSNYSEAVS